MSFATSFNDISGAVYVDSTSSADLRSKSSLELATETVNRKSPEELLRMVEDDVAEFSHYDENDNRVYYIEDDGDIESISMNELRKDAIKIVNEMYVNAELGSDSDINLTQQSNVSKNIIIPEYIKVKIEIKYIIIVVIILIVIILLFIICSYFVNKYRYRHDSDS